MALLSCLLTSASLFLRRYSYILAPNAQHLLTWEKSFHVLYYPKQHTNQQPWTRFTHTSTCGSATNATRAPIMSILALLARIRLASATFVANTVVLKDTRSILATRGTVRSLAELDGLDSLRRHAGIFSPSDNTSKGRDLARSMTF